MTFAVLAPSASLVAISRRRAETRTNMSVATLAQATSRRIANGPAHDEQWESHSTRQHIRQRPDVNVESFGHRCRFGPELALERLHPGDGLVARHLGREPGDDGQVPRPVLVARCCWMSYR